MRIHVVVQMIQKELVFLFRRPWTLCWNPYVVVYAYAYQKNLFWEL